MPSARHSNGAPLSFLPSDGTDFNRVVRVIRENEALFRYVETTRIFDGDRQVNYTDAFQIRHWYESQVLNALERAGFEVEANLSARFAGSGSHYYLASRRARR